MPGFPWWKEKPEVMPRARKYPVELLERATRLVFESGRPITHLRNPVYQELGNPGLAQPMFAKALSAVARSALLSAAWAGDTMR